MPITRLLDEGSAVTAWFMNPNVQPLAEYLRRREAAGECAARLGVNILYADETWNITAWLRAVAGRDEAPARCAYCCEKPRGSGVRQGRLWVSPGSAPACSTPVTSRTRLLRRRTPPDQLSGPASFIATSQGLADGHRPLQGLGAVPPALLRLRIQRGGPLPESLNAAKRGGYTDFTKSHRFLQKSIFSLDLAGAFP